MLDAVLYVTSGVEDAATRRTTVEYMFDWREVIEDRGVAHNDAVPVFHIGIVVDESREGVPLVLGSNKTWVWP